MNGWEGACRRGSASLPWVLTAMLVLAGCRRESEPLMLRKSLDDLGEVLESETKWLRPSDEAVRAKLSALAYRVTQEGGTEPPFQNAFWDHHEPGLYVDVVSGEPLFSSADKFDSGTGWPSFVRPVDPQHITTHSDRAHGMSRTEVRSRSGKSHLGHVFPDGPVNRGGLRYCMNSASLRFIPREKIVEEGYGAYLAQVDGGGSDASPVAPAVAQPRAASCESSFEVMIVAGGCFWGMEAILREVPGVVATEVGYIGGATPTPRYSDVRTGQTGHAEAVRVTFDPREVSYAELLERWFFRMHDPTTLNRQGNDVGTQYRSVIFTLSAEQVETARRVKRAVEASGLWERPLVTAIEPAGAWTAAEEEHQDYLEKHPGGYSCHFLR